MKSTAEILIGKPRHEWKRIDVWALRLLFSLLGSGLFFALTLAINFIHPRIIYFKTGVFILGGAFFYFLTLNIILFFIIPLPAHIRRDLEQKPSLIKRFFSFLITLVKKLFKNMKSLFTFGKKITLPSRKKLPSKKKRQSRPLHKKT